MAPGFILQSFSAIKGKMIKQVLDVEPTCPTTTSISQTLPVRDPFAGDSPISTREPMTLSRAKARAAINAPTIASRSILRADALEA
jgi:hypothetical protein